MPADPKTPPENPWLNLVLNLVLPSLILIKGAGWAKRWDWPVSPAWILVIALIFPLGYGSYNLWRRQKYNVFSIVGIIGILLIGSVGLLELPKEWVAVKEAVVPGIVGIAVLVATRLDRLWFQALFYNPQVFNTARIDTALRERGNQSVFRQLLVRYQYWIGGSFLISAVLNYGIARSVVVSESGSEAFVEELGRMTLLGYAFIALPFLGLFFCIFLNIARRLQQLSGLSREDMLPPT